MHATAGSRSEGPDLNLPVNNGDQSRNALNDDGSRGLVAGDEDEELTLGLGIAERTWGTAASRGG
jgi:hypothetical protein